MEKLASFCFSMATNTKQLARLKAGFLIREIFNRFTMKANLKLHPDRSLWVYSGHDSTVSNILNALGFFDVSYTLFEKKLGKYQTHTYFYIY